MVSYNVEKKEFIVDIQGKNASELHYKSPAAEEIPTIGCGNGINDGITLNGITIVPKDTEITWSCDDMCSRTEAMLRNIHSAAIIGVRWGP